MSEHDPDRTLPTPKPTETQRFQPVRHPDVTLPPVRTPDHDKTNPHIRVGTFPEHPIAKAERPPGRVYDPSETFEYGGMKLSKVSRLPNGDRQGTEENGITFVVPRDEWKNYDPHFNPETDE
jgi:hypothetical protein